MGLPGTPDTVRCARPGQASVGFAPFYLNPILDFLLVCVEPLAPVELIYLIRLGKANIIVSGGAEAAICACGVGGFNAMHALSTRNDDPEHAS